jgi:hypothetical protein
MGFDDYSVAWFLASAISIPFASIPHHSTLAYILLLCSPLELPSSRIASLVPRVRVAQRDLRIAALLGSWLLPFPLRSFPSLTILYYPTTYPLLL